MPDIRLQLLIGDNRSVMAIELPTQQQAAVYRAPDDVRLETVPVPQVGPGEVLLRIDTCGICGTDLKKIHTGSHAAPRIFGHEMAGTVAAVGEGVTAWQAGRPRDGVPPHPVRGVLLLP